MASALYQGVTAEWGVMKNIQIFRKIFLLVKLQGNEKFFKLVFLYLFFLWGTAALFLNFFHYFFVGVSIGDVASHPINIVGATRDTILFTALSILFLPEALFGKRRLAGQVFFLTAVFRFCSLIYVYLTNYGDVSSLGLYAYILNYVCLVIATFFITSAIYIHCGKRVTIKFLKVEDIIIFSVAFLALFSKILYDSGAETPLFEAVAFLLASIAFAVQLAKMIFELFRQQT